MAEIKNPDKHIETPEEKKANLENLQKVETRKQEAAAKLDHARTNDNVQKVATSPEKNKEVEENKAKEKTETVEDKKARLGAKLDKSSLEKVEKNESSFAGEKFRKEDSFDAKARKEHPELNDLKTKCVYDVKPMGTPKEEIDRRQVGTYTEEEKKYLKDVRETVEAPTTDTVMQKVIGVDTGDVKEDLKYYLNPTTKDGRETEAQVYGFVAKAEDAAPFTDTPQKCYDNLRLDYDPGENKVNPYQNPEQSVYVIRYTDGTNYDIPYSEEFGGNTKEGQPFTGNGFVSGKEVTIPEYVVNKDSGKGAVVTDGEIYRINADGKEEKVAYYDDESQKFKLYKKEETE